MSKIYDSFLFFNELDLLEIRLKILDPYVDFFVISESDYTFSGNKKPFYFDENKNMFDKFLHKIIHIKNHDSDKTNNLINPYNGKKEIIFNKIINDYLNIKNTEETDFGKPYWCREFLQREFVGLGLSDVDDDDIIIFSDLDELPSPEIFEKLNKIDLDNNKYCLNMDNFNYFVNTTTNTNWFGGVISKYKNIKESSLNNIRKIRTKYIKINDGGWHLSYMGGEDRIKYKIESFSHQEFNNNYFKSNISNNVNNNLDLFNRYSNITTIDLKSYNYPDTFLNLIKNKYQYLLKP
jgi:beta-1,4-mannosyl-glycoprotein beta-1,4-N-acetylglucosaminyltransferase